MTSTFARDTSFQGNGRPQPASKVHAPSEKVRFLWSCRCLNVSLRLHDSSLRISGWMSTRCNRFVHTHFVRHVQAVARSPCVLARRHQCSIWWRSWWSWWWSWRWHKIPPPDLRRDTLVMIGRVGDVLGPCLSGLR